MDRSLDLSQLVAEHLPVRDEETPDDLEQTWVAAAARGDDEAFRQLVERYQERIYHFCYQWLRNAEDAREACQDTFVRAYQALPRFVPRSTFLAWLYRIALNLCRDRHKSRSARQRRATKSLTGAESNLACRHPSPDESAAQSADLKKLYRGLEALPEPLRAVLILRTLEGLSQEDSARILQCSVRAVEGRLYRARKALADWWEQDQES